MEMSCNKLLFLDFYFDRRFVIADLFFRPFCGLNCPGVSRIFYGLKISCTAPNHYAIEATGMLSDNYDSHHPFNVLAHWLFTIKNRPFLEASVPSLFPIQIINLIEGRQNRESARKNFLETLKTDFPGSIKVYKIAAVSDRLECLAPPLSLFGLTWVFPWAVHMLNSLPPNCAMTDATFSVMKPSVLEFLHVIFCNESIPIALAVFPTETMQSYTRLYEHVGRVLMTNDAPADLLDKLPLVSDEGSALEALIASKGLDWKWCHHHLVKKAGASTIMGDWVSRLLRTCSYDDATLVAANIRAEITLLESQGANAFNHSKNSLLANMLQSLGRDQLPIFLKRWARWERFGCPTTTNAAESTHARLNSHLKELTNAHFIGRLRVVWKQLKRRFVERNSEDRIRNRSWNRFNMRSAKSRNQMPAAMSEFYKRLHSLGNGRHPGVLMFPVFLDRHEWSSDFAEEIVRDQLPDSWLRPKELAAPEEREPVAGVEGDDFPDEADDPIPFPELLEIPGVPENHDMSQSLAVFPNPIARLNPSHNAAAWDIIASVHRLARNSKEWTTERWKHVIGTVFTIGVDYLPDGESKLQPDAEALWRVRSLQEIGIERSIFE
jgi:hypothetical protein